LSHVVDVGLLVNFFAIFGRLQRLYQAIALNCYRQYQQQLHIKLVDTSMIPDNERYLILIYLSAPEFIIPVLEVQPF
jgi:hypothetical protein